MKIIFIHHSSFLVEIEDKLLLFDFFQKERMSGFKFDGVLPELDLNKQLYIFSSHGHPDHFDLEVLHWATKHPQITYVLSKDIRLSDNFLTKQGISLSVRDMIHFVKANELLSVDGLEIQTFLSTDMGVAFLVSYAGKTIFHAGDLNWWHWAGEDQTFLASQAKTFQEQIDKLTGISIDVAFVVMDPRLGESVYWGVDYFMKQVNARYVIPMHLWQHYELIETYKNTLGTDRLREKIVEVEKENQVIELAEV
jgi:L-ascorbate metabolism protein UlaG (beta-lactamase superfamily)